VAKETAIIEREHHFVKSNLVDASKPE
jgi:hypothetical protein